MRRLLLPLAAVGLVSCETAAGLAPDRFELHAYQSWGEGAGMIDGPAAVDFGTRDRRDSVTLGVTFGWDLGIDRMARALRREAALEDLREDAELGELYGPPAPSGVGSTETPPKAPPRDDAQPAAPTSALDAIAGPGTRWDILGPAIFAAILGVLYALRGLLKAATLYLLGRTSPESQEVAEMVEGGADLVDAFQNHPGAAAPPS